MGILELFVFSIVISWVTAPEPVPYPCYEQIDNTFVPYICEDLQ